MGYPALLLLCFLACFSSCFWTDFGLTSNDCLTPPSLWKYSHLPRPFLPSQRCTHLPTPPSNLQQMMHCRGARVCLILFLGYSPTSMFPTIENDWPCNALAVGSWNPNPWQIGYWVKKLVEGLTGWHGNTWLMNCWRGAWLGSAAESVRLCFGDVVGNSLITFVPITSRKGLNFGSLSRIGSKANSTYLEMIHLAV